MPNIDTLLSNIMEAKYGEAVRSSIHDAIEAINEVVENWEDGQMDDTFTSTTLPASAKAVGDSLDNLQDSSIKYSDSNIIDQLSYTIKSETLTNRTQTLQPFDTVGKAYIAANGKLIVNGSGITDSFVVSRYSAIKGETYYFVGKNARLRGDYPFAAFYKHANDTGTVIVQGSATETNYNQSYTPDEDGYICIASHTAYNSLSLRRNVDSVPCIKEPIFKESDITWSPGYWDRTGILRSQDGYRVTNYIPVSAGCRVIAAILGSVGGDNSEARSAYFFDVNKNPVVAVNTRSYVSVIVDSTLSANYKDIAYVSIGTTYSGASMANINIMIESGAIINTLDSRVNATEKRVESAHDDANSNIVDQLKYTINSSLVNRIQTLTPFETVDIAYLYDVGNILGESGTTNCIVVVNGSGITSTFKVEKYFVKKGITYTISGENARLGGSYPFAAFYKPNYNVGTVIVQGSSTETDYNESYTPTEDGYIYLAVRTNFNRTYLKKNTVSVLPSLSGAMGLNGKIVYTLGDSITWAGNSWAFQLANLSGAEKVYNLARGGATWKDRDSMIIYDENCEIWNNSFVYNTSSDGKTESYPDNRDLSTAVVPIDNGSYTCISNEIRFMKRLITTWNRPQPDVIVIACGINDSKSFIQPYSDEAYNSIIETPLAEMTFAQKNTIGGGLRYCIETLMTEYPNAEIIISTPVQSAYLYLRPYIPDARKWITKFHEYYATKFIDAFSESGISAVFEKGWNDSHYIENNPGRYLYDGLHPNTAGKNLMAKYFAREICKKAV